MIAHGNPAVDLTPFESLKEAWLYEKADEQAVICNLCAHRCYIPPGRVGICKVRENRAGRLYTLVYDRTIAQDIDPIEKKPLFHVLPSTRTYSIATVGCNFHCRFCQNWEIAQGPRLGRPIDARALPPDQAVAEARGAGALAIAYTYIEPTVFLEHVLGVPGAVGEGGERGARAALGVGEDLDHRDAQALRAGPEADRAGQGDEADGDENGRAAATVPEQASCDAAQSDDPFEIQHGLPLHPRPSSCRPCRADVS